MIQLQVNYVSGPSQLNWAQYQPHLVPMPPLTARGGPPPPNAPLPPPPMPPGGMMAGGRTEVMIPVPDVRIGAVIGKGGEIITQLKTLVGVKIRISDRDNFVPGTRDRKVAFSSHVHLSLTVVHFWKDLIPFAPVMCATYCKRRKEVK